MMLHLIITHRSLAFPDIKKLNIKAEKGTVSIDTKIIILFVIDIAMDLLKI